MGEDLKPESLSDRVSTLRMRIVYASLSKTYKILNRDITKAIPKRFDIASYSAISVGPFVLRRDPGNIAYKL